MTRLEHCQHPGTIPLTIIQSPNTTEPGTLQESYNRWVVPWVGGMITGSPESYRYLADSIDAFSTRTDFEALLDAHGFRSTGREFFPPVASLVVGERVEVSGG